MVGVAQTRETIGKSPSSPDTNSAPTEPESRAETWGERFSRYWAFWERNWKAAGAWILCAGFLGWVAWDWGWQPVLWTLGLGGWLAIWLWRAVRIYYQHLMEVDFDPEDEKHTLQLWSIPIDKMHRLDVDGPRGMIHDRKGTEFLIVSEFVGDDGYGGMWARGAWNANWTQLHLVLWIKSAWRMLKLAEAAWAKYSFAKIRATAEMLQDRDMIGREIDFAMQLMDPDYITAESYEHESRKLRKDAEDAKRRYRDRVTVRYSDEGDIEP